MGGPEPLDDQLQGDEPQVSTILLGLGSNVGDRVRLLERALERLRQSIQLERISSIYETQPVGVRDQPWFLNLVCLGHTRLQPYGLLEFLHEVENSLFHFRRDHGSRRVCTHTAGIWTRVTIVAGFVIL